LELQSLWAPSFTLKEEKLIVGWRIKNSFPDPKESVLILSANDKVVKSKPIEIKGSERKSGNLSWLPPVEGNYRMELKIKNIKGESFSENNHKKFKLRVDRKNIKSTHHRILPALGVSIFEKCPPERPGCRSKELTFPPRNAQCQRRKLLTCLSR
jgi:hypothetical protein